MKGRIAVIDRFRGRMAAALIADGQLEDFLIDPVDVLAPHPGAIYRAIADRPIKGQNGLMLKLGDGQTGFLRQAKGVQPGQGMLVQVASQTEPGKAAPVTTLLTAPTSPITQALLRDATATLWRPNGGDA